MKWNETEKKQLIIFTLTAFCLPLLMGIALGISYYRGNDVSIFAVVQMYYPAAGVMLALLLTSRKEERLPKKYFTGFLVTTVILMAAALISVFTPQINWMIAQEFLMIGLTIFCLVLLLLEKKEVRARYGLKFTGKKNARSWLYVLLFLALYFARLIINGLMTGQTKEALAIFTIPEIYGTMLYLAIIFFITFTPFFGEEYGWRYFFQPLLQKRFGQKGGVLVLGVLWGLWHLPLNIFYYSPQTWQVSVAIQIVTCISLGIFFGYAYMKTENIWMVSMLHFWNNNLAAVLSGGAIGGVDVKWGDVLALLILNLVFVVFIFSKVYRKKLLDENLV